VDANTNYLQRASIGFTSTLSKANIEEAVTGEKFLQDSQALRKRCRSGVFSHVRDHVVMVQSLYAPRFLQLSFLPAKVGAVTLVQSSRRLLAPGLLQVVKLMRLGFIYIKIV